MTFSAGSEISRREMPSIDGGLTIMEAAHRDATLRRMIAVSDLLELFRASVKIQHLRICDRLIEQDGSFDQVHVGRNHATEVWMAILTHSARANPISASV
jgi:hypothetical protein